MVSMSKTQAKYNQTMILFKLCDIESTSHKDVHISHSEQLPYTKPPILIVQENWLPEAAIFASTS